MGHIGRNEKCPCGNGLKYKRCCLASDLSRPEQASMRNLTQKIKTIHSKSGRMQSSYELPQNVKKTSEIILDFADPYLKKCGDSLETQKKIIHFAIMAWTISESEGDIDSNIKECSNKMFRNKNSEAIYEFESLLLNMVQRKLKYFSNIKRKIIDYEIVQPVDGGLHLNVVTGFSSDDLGRENNHLLSLI